MDIFKEITLDDKHKFDSYFSKYNPQISELTFTNIFMWRNFYQFRYAEIMDMLCIIAMPRESEAFSFLPIGSYNEYNFKNSLFSIHQYFGDRGLKFKIKRVHEDELEYFKKIDIEYMVEPDQNNNDYVYLQENLQYLKGKKYDGKRNHISRLKREHEIRYTKLDEGHIDACIDIMDQWCAQRSCEQHRELYCEKLANYELLKNYRVLRCTGAGIFVDGKMQAFTIGEQLNTNTAVVHIEKANADIHGLYTFINQQFCENELYLMEYINREQDLGSEGLRKAKLSYHPVKLVNKYTITIRGKH